MLNKKKTLYLLLSHPLFSVLKEEILANIVDDARCFRSQSVAGKSVLSDNSFSSALGIVLSGSVLVYRKGGGTPVLLQRLCRGDVFGAASLFSKEKSYPTDIKAENECEVFFIPSELIKELIQNNSDFAFEYVCFLSEKIRFLNKRLSELSAPSITQKLAAFLLRGENRIAVNRVQLASALGIGRASLYRALDELSEKKLISVENKTVIVTDREGLKNLI